MLEHVHSPDVVVSEIYRVLKARGLCQCRGTFPARLPRLSARLPAVDSIRYCTTVCRLYRDRERRVCRSHDRFTLDLPRIRWAPLFFWESSRREGGFTAYRMANISIPALGCSVIPTQGCSYFGISRLFFRKETVLSCQLSVISFQELAVGNHQPLDLSGPSFCPLLARFSVIL